MSASAHLSRVSQPATGGPAAAPLPEWLAIVREKVESLRYGVVQIVVHDRRVTQIERTEKTRLPGGGASDGGLGDTP